jgi:hypothetical protein
MPSLAMEIQIESLLDLRPAGAKEIAKALIEAPLVTL